MNNQSNTAQTIEAILFATADSYTVAMLAKITEIPVSDVEQALAILEDSLQNHGFMLIRNANTVTLATRPEHGALLETIRKEELQKDLSKASAETLAVVVYHPGATRAEIELIRGVNTSYSLRALQIRGLIEATGSGRAITYVPTVALLESYGVASVEALPEYLETKQKIDTLL